MSSKEKVTPKSVFCLSLPKKVYIELSYSPKFQLLKCILSTCRNLSQLLAKFKMILYMGFRATLNFRKFITNVDILKCFVIKRAFRRPAGYLTKFNTGRLRPKVQPVTLLYTILAEKVPLLYTCY